MKSVVPSILLWWRPKLILALVLGALGAVWEPGAFPGTAGSPEMAAQSAGEYADLITPRQMFARALLLITAIEAVWWIGRNAYDAYRDTRDDVVSEVGTTLIEAMVLYSGYLSILAGTTVLSGMLEATRAALFGSTLNLAFWAGIALIQLTRIVIHWKGSEDAARRFFSRIGRAWKSARNGPADPDATFDRVQKENA